MNAPQGYDHPEDIIERREIDPRPTYNGWRNRETWCVNLWLSNDEGTYTDCRAIVAGFNDYDARGALSEYVDDLVQNTLGDDHQATMLDDLIGGSLAYVDWQSIVDAFRED